MCGESSHDYVATILSSRGGDPLEQGSTAPPPCNPPAERVFSVLFFVSSSVYQQFKYNYMSCTCEIDDDTLVYACQGCGKVVDTRYGIEYRTQKPYPHSKWFCDMTCVVLRHAMLAKSIKCNMIDALDPEVQEYIEALNDIEKYIGCCAEGDTVELTSTDFVVKAKLRVSGLVC